MGSVIDLLAAARAAGLKLEAHGNRLRVTGPKSAGAIVREIKARKPEVLAALTTTSDHDRDPIRWAFRAAGLPVEMPADREAARERLHRLLEHRAPRPEGVPAGRDVVVLLGGRCPRPRLIRSYEPWPDDPAALPLRWRPTDSEAWRALGLPDSNNEGGKE